jgi:HrpA-like RNA helicase
MFSAPNQTHMQIAPHLPAIIKLISSNPTVSIVAPTGSGKSVGIPAAIASAGSRCFVTVPTRTAAISLAEYQRVLQRAANPAADVDRLVGFAAEGNVNYGPDTKIAYVTGGHARRKMLSYFSKGIVRPINFCDVLMVDEVHSGSIDTTMVISLWMKAAASGISVPRLVIASATPVPIAINPPPALYTVELAAFPITYEYLERDFDLDDPNGMLYTEAARVAAKLHQTTPVSTGHMLIFAPGAAEVESIDASLRELLKNPVAGTTVTIIPAFAALKQEDIALIYHEAGPNERKIVIATNIAEMSITIPDIGYVIDTMVEKRAETSQSGGFRLATHYISKDSAKQRAGRTGRTRPGVCYRLGTALLYASLEDHRPPEIERVPIYEVVMELLDVGLAPETVIQGIDPQRVIQAVQLLTRLGMITTTPTGIAVTEMGHFAPKFHISVRNAAFLWKWIEAKYPIFPGIVAAVLIDSYGPSYFWIPRKKKETDPEDYNEFVRAHKEKYFSKYLGYNDLETSLNMWNDLMETTGGINAQQRTIIQWARDNSINNKKIRELLMIIQQCANAAAKEGHQVSIAPFTTNGVMTAARPILLSVYSDVTFIHRRDTTYFSPITRSECRLDNRNSVNRLIENPPKGVIALSVAEIKIAKGSFCIIGFAVDTDKDGLGRPIVIRGGPATPRGPRTLARGRGEVGERAPRIAPAQIPTETVGVNEALGLLAGLNLGAPEVAPATIQPTEPAQQVIVPEPVIVQALGPPSIDREYTRFWYVNSMKDYIEAHLGPKQSYEALNALERWLIGLANIPSVPDPIFVAQKLDVANSLSTTFATEMANKHITDAGTIAGTCIGIAIQFTQLPQFESAPIPTRDGDVIVVGPYSRALPLGRLNLLLQKGTLTDVAMMALRYSSLLPRGQQWNIPRPIYELMVNKYGINIEGFGSPINSQIIAINPNLHFCSLFPDTDAIFGSLGSFFSQNFDNVKIMANPPFVLELMNEMSRFLNLRFQAATNLMCVITVPAWTDAEYYQSLNTSRYLKMAIELSPRAHYYVNSNENDAKVVASFSSRIFILSKGFPDPNYNQLQSEIIGIYRR